MHVFCFGFGSGSCIGVFRFCHLLPNSDCPFIRISGNSHVCLFVHCPRRISPVCSCPTGRRSAMGVRARGLPVCLPICLSVNQSDRLSVCSCWPASTLVMGATGFLFSSQLKGLMMVHPHYSGAGTPCKPMMNLTQSPSKQFKHVWKVFQEATRTTSTFLSRS